jgi:hypothetical protein
MNALHIAQINIAKMKAALEDPVMAGFVARLEEINALADRSAGFVWRLQTSEGNATYLRPYDDDRILFNMSVWESIEHLKRYARGHVPGITFKNAFPADEQFVKGIDWSSFNPRPAA